MHGIVNDEALDTLFRAARCNRAWLARPVSDTLLCAVLELVTLGPTGGAGPARILFVRSEDAKARLGPAISAKERTGIMTAPIAAIVGHPLDHAPGHAPCHTPVHHRRCAALHDAALQAAYLILACRALGLDCGPIWKFDASLVDAAFFPEGTIASNFVCALGYGDDTQASPHQVRPGVADACTIL
jgi:3-hydroxypropanoate dehydrogenase